MTIEEGIKLLNAIGMKELGIKTWKKPRRSFWYFCEDCFIFIKKMEKEKHSGHKIKRGKR